MRYQYFSEGASTTSSPSLPKRSHLFGPLYQTSTPPTSRLRLLLWKVIPRQTIYADIHKTFSVYGKIAKVTQDLDDANSALVTFEQEAAAKRALIRNNTLIKYSRVRVTMASSIEAGYCTSILILYVEYTLFETCISLT